MEMILQNDRYDLNENTYRKKENALEARTKDKVEEINDDCKKHNVQWRNKFTLHRNEVIPQYRIPFINTGYRRPNLNVSECLHSVFIASCNETVNFWSHFIAFLLFILKFQALFSREANSLADSSNWPLLSAALGNIGFCLASSSAHLFNSMSPSAQHSCFFMDYAAIGVYSVGVGQAFFFYARPISPEIPLFKSEWPFTVVSLSTSIITTFLCCVSRLQWLKYKYVIRTSSFVAPFLVNASPYLYRMIYCSDDIDCISQDSLRVFNIHCFFYVASALINMLRVPERVFPGKFDLLGHSHHFLHIFTAIGASYQFDSINLDMIARKNHLLQRSIRGNLCNTVLPFVISLLTNFGIAFAFGKKAEKHIEENEKVKEK